MARDDARGGGALPPPDSPSAASTGRGFSPGRWPLWPVFRPDAMVAEQNRRYIFGLHLPLIAACGAALWLPAVRRLTGLEPLTASLLLALHGVMVSLLVLTPLPRRAPRAAGLFAFVVNVVVSQGLVAATGSPHTPLWALTLVYPAMAALAFGRSTFAAVSVALAPTGVSATWALAGVCPVGESLGYALVFGLVATTAYVMFAHHGDTLRALHRENAALRAATAVQAERERIAADLHGTVGASLTEVSLWLGLATVGEGAVARDALDRAHARSLAVLDELRLGLGRVAEARACLVEFERLLRARLEGLCQASGVRLVLDVRAARPELPSEQAYALFKVIEEAGLNAIKHAAPRTLEVSLEVGDAVVARVCDDGRGFDAASAPRGRGLQALERFALQLGARLHLESLPGRGTVVQVSATAA